MAKRAVAGSKAKGDTPAADQFHDRWRAALGGFALALWREGADGTPAVRPDPMLLAPLGNMADEALGLVETFTLGALARTRRGGTFTTSPPDPFTTQLALLLKGLEPPAVIHGEAGRTTAPLIFQSELWQFLHKTRESAELSYAREFDLVELDRRILFLRFRTSERIRSRRSLYVTGRSREACR